MLERLRIISSQNRRLVATVVCLTLTFYPDLEASSDPDIASTAARASVIDAGSPAHLCDENPKIAAPLELCFEPDQWLATGARRAATFAPSALFLPPVPGRSVD